MELFAIAVLCGVVGYVMSHVLATLIEAAFEFVAKRKK